MRLPRVCAFIRWSSGFGRSHRGCVLNTCEEGDLLLESVTDVQIDNEWILLVQTILLSLYIEFPLPLHSPVLFNFRQSLCVWMN
jgi:hypothetical protein